MLTLWRGEATTTSKTIQLQSIILIVIILTRILISIIIVIIIAHEPPPELPITPVFSNASRLCILLLVG